MTPAERFQRSPRPLEYVRPKLTLEIAQYLSDLLADERAAEVEELTKLRAAGKQEGDQEIEETVAVLRTIISAEKEINKTLIDLVGPRG